MVTLETLEGVLNGEWRYHYDVTADVLYLRLVSAEGVETVGDLNDDDDIVLHSVATDAAVGITVIGWWRRFGGSTSLPDSLTDIERRIAPFAMRLAD